jgi:Family of unknown function (DUF5723)
VKKILFLSILSFHLKAHASDWIFDRDSTFHNSLTISSDYYFASNAITNQFALAYFRNEFIDNVKKDNVTDHLSSLNRFGTEFLAQIKYSSTNKTIFNLPNSFFSVSLNSRYHVNSEFKYDAFQLYFRGNSAYRNKTADLGSFVYNQVYYQQVNFTFGHKFKRDENKFGFAAGLNYNNGQKLYVIDAERATIFTDDQGKYLDLDANIEIHQSDSSNDELSSFNGAGCSADLYWFWTNKKNNTLKISATNFGFISWNSETAFIKADTALRFNGVDVSNLFLLSDSVKEVISLDSSLVEPYLSEREKKNYFYLLPANLSLSYQYQLQHGINLEGSVEYLFFAGSTLRESLTISYEFNSKSNVSLIASNGGYTGFNAGLAFTTFFLNRWRFTAQSDYLTGMFNSSQGIAQGAFVSLTAYF